MKKILLFSFLLSLFNFNMQSEASVHKIIKRVDLKTSSDGLDNNCFYIYDANNNLIWIQESSVRYEYENNALGQPIKRTTLSWVEAEKQYRDMGYETYQYNADGTLKTLIKFKTNYRGDIIQDRYEYTEYDGDIATKYEWYENDVLFYQYEVNLTKKDGRVTKAETRKYDPDDKKYTNEYLSEEYTYDSNGDRVKVVTTKGTKTILGTISNKTTATSTYAYTDLNASYAPRNLNATVNNGTVTLKWSTVSDADSYIVTYDQSREKVSRNSFVKVVNTGVRKFTVQAVVDGVERNATTPVTVELVDNGKLPITDLKAGQCYQTVVKPDAGDDREFYNIPLTWTLPQGHSAIQSFRIYYDSRTYGRATYQPLESPDATSFTLKVDPYEVRNMDGKGNLTTGIDTSIYITIIYNTGESEKSNVITVNPYNDVVSGIDEVSVDDNGEDRNIYNVAGQRVDNMKGLVIKNGKKYMKF